MPTVTGNLQTIIDEEPNLGSIEVALCGYGSQIPRVIGGGLTARVMDNSPDINNSDGSFSFTVDGNDVILPEGTYYTVTVRDDNGDICQVNAYRFLSTESEYELTGENPIDPFDPSLLMPPALPPLVTNLLLVVPYDPAAEFPGDTYLAWQITLTGDCAPTFTDLVDGNLYTMIVVQDGIGFHMFLWPSIVINPTPVNYAPNGVFVQTFVAVSGILYPIGPATYTP